MSAVFTRDPDAETRADIIRSTADALKDAWNKHDAKAFTDAFTDDAEFTNVFGMVSRGRGEIERTHAFIFEGFLKDSRWTKSDVTVRMIEPGVASVDVRWELVGSRDPEGNPWSPRTGVMTLIVVKSYGAWKIDVFHNIETSERTPGAVRWAKARCSVPK